MLTILWIGMVRSGGSLRPDELPKRQKALRQISVSECEFSKPVDQVFLIQTGTAPGDIHVADRLSQTSCLFHPDFLPQVKKISTLSDRHLPEGVLFVFKTPISTKKIQKHKILLCKKSLFSLHKQNKEIPYKKSWFRNFFVRNSLFWGFLHQTNLLFIFVLLFFRMEVCEGGAVCQFSKHPGVDPDEKRDGHGG